MEKLIPTALMIAAQLLSFSTAAQDKQKAELYVETGSADSITTIKFSPDGKSLPKFSNKYRDAISSSRSRRKIL